MELSEKERSLLCHIAGRKNLYLIFSIVSVVVAVSLLIYNGIIAKDLSPLRFVIVILILLTARAHLRQYRSALILHKLKLWLERKEK
ncbi:MAG: hypothetical protein C4538_11865 [Nitrospiraceae bacterium]|nr:MAG: hypothetical protein C4538_11865 [Nitrospiraceae bacterium]